MIGNKTENAYVNEGATKNESANMNRNARLLFLLYGRHHVRCGCEEGVNVMRAEVGLERIRPGLARSSRPASIQRFYAYSTFHSGVDIHNLKKLNTLIAAEGDG